MKITISQITKTIVTIPITMEVIQVQMGTYILNILD